MKKVGIICSNESPTVDAIKNYLQDVEVSLIKEYQAEDLSSFDLVVGIQAPDDFADINVHHSLLPAFTGDEPVKQAFLEGVKVTGISFYYAKTGKIIAQYPIFIKSNSHYDEIVEEMQYLEQSLYPVIINSVLKNEFFEIEKFLNTGCSSCGGCKQCSH